MTSRTQQARAESGNTPPANNSLLPGQIYLELADPMRIWAGVPTSINPNGVRLIFDASIASEALNKTGDTATGLINFSGGINVTNAPANVPLAPQDTNTTQAASTSYVLNQADSTNPLMDGAAAAGTRTRWSRGDHVHPSDTTKAPLNSPTFTGTPLLTTTPPQDDNTFKVADTAYVIGQASTVTPLMDGAAVPGVSLRYARADHVHPTDNSIKAVTVSDVPPASPHAGDFWFDSIGVQLYLYYNDGTSSQWVPANNQALAGFLALSGGTMSGPITMPGTAPAANQVPTYSQAVAPNVGRNLIDNAMFNIAQRGASFSVAAGTQVYTMDRWPALTGASGDTLTVTQGPLTDADRAAIGDEAASFCYSSVFTGGAAAGNFIMPLAQRIEGVRRTAGKTITISFFAVANTAGLKLGVSLDQSFGSGGSASAAVIINGQAVTLANTWARYQLTFTVPSATGKTLGTNSNDALGVDFWTSAGANQNVRAGNIGMQSGTILIWGVQVEIGTQATPLEKLDPERDLARCQRFYFANPNIYQQGYSPGVGGGVGTGMHFPVTMRAAPTVNVTPSGGSGYSGANVLGVTAQGCTPSLTANVNANPVYGGLSLTASADL